VARRFGTELPGLVAAALVVVSVAFAWKWLPESRLLPPPDGVADLHEPPPSRSVKRALWEVVRHPTWPAHRVIWIYIVGMLALNVVIGVLALYLKDAYGVTEQTIGYFFPIFGVVGVLMRVSLVGWFNDRFGEIRTMQIGTMSLLAGLALMPLPVVILPSLPAMLLFIVFLAFVPVGTALLFPASTSLVSQRTNQRELGLTMGAQQTFRGIVSIVGPIGGAFLFDRIGHGVPFLAAAAVVGVASVLAFRERAQGERDRVGVTQIARSESG
jgi:MFS family permease